MKKILSVLLVIILCLSFCACGAAKSAATDFHEEAPAAVANYYAESSGLAMMDAAAEEYAYGAEIPSPVDGGENGKAPETNPEKIIYSADATVETTDFDGTIEGLKKLIADYKAYIESSSISGANYRSIQSGGRQTRNADYVIRVPVENFDKLMNSLSSLGNVPYNHVYTENVSDQYYDTEARLKTYQAQEERLTELLDMADTVTEVIEIENELSEVRYRIESLQTTLRGWDGRVVYSTVCLSVQEVQEYTPEDIPGYGRRLLKSLADGFDNLGYFVLDLAEALPVIILLAVFAVGIVHIVKKTARKRKAKKTE